MDRKYQMPPDAKELRTTGADKIAAPVNGSGGESSQIGQQHTASGDTMGTDKRSQPDGVKNSGMRP